MNPNIIAGLFIAIYLIAAGINHKTDSVIEAVKQESAFLKWFIALVIILIIDEYADLGTIGSMLKVMMFLALALNLSASGQIDNVSKELQSLIK